MSFFEGEDELHQDIAFMQGKTRRVAGAFGDYPEQDHDDLTDSVPAFMLSQARRRSWAWLRWGWFAGFLWICVQVLSGNCEWWWAVVFQCAAWFWFTLRGKHGA